METEMNLTDLIPWPYRLLAIAALAVALLGFGWVKGASHEQAKNEAKEQAQAIKNVRIETQQKAKTQETNHEAINLIDRSDAYYRGVRLGPHSVPSLSRAAGQADAAAQAGPPDPAGHPEGIGDTNGTPNYSKNYSCDSADGSADAIQVIEFQRWVRAMQEAEN
jgi:hypothetical protein